MAAENNAETILTDFIEPFLEDIFDLYPEKTLENKAIVGGLLNSITLPKLNLSIIKFLAKRHETKELPDTLLTRMEILYKSYHEYQHLLALYPTILMNEGKYKRIHSQLASKIFNKYYAELGISTYFNNDLLTDIFQNGHYTHLPIARFMSILADGVAPSFLRVETKKIYNFSGLSFVGCSFKRRSERPRSIAGVLG